MPYILTKTNGTQLTIIQDGSLDNSTDLTFVGKNYAGYGQIENENLVKLLENFASPSAPSKPLVGQLWYDTTNKKIKVYNGISFRDIVLGSSTGSLPPKDQVAGDIFWDSADQKLYVFNGIENILIGPLGNSSPLVSSVISSTVKDSNNNERIILKASLPKGSPALFNADITFNSKSDQSIYGTFPKVQQGITLPGTSADGVSSDYQLTPGNPMLWGTAATAWGMVENGVRVLATSYVKRTELQGFSNELNLLTDEGILVGQSGVMRLHAKSLVGYVSNVASQTINFNVMDGVGSQTSSTVISLTSNGGLSLAPGAGKTVFLGYTGNPFADTYSTVVHTGKITTSPTDNVATTGTLYGNWTVYGNITLASGSTLGATQSTNATNAVYLQNAAGTEYIHTTTTGESNKVAQIDSSGALTLPTLTAMAGGSVITGDWGLQSGATLQASSIRSGTSFVVPDILANNNTLALRDGTGGLTVGAFIASSVRSPSLSAGASNNDNGAIYGQWTLASGATLQATYADIAERYESDRADYMPGCVMVIGGEKEITLSNERASIKWAGILSTNPAFKLNGDAGDDATHPFVALKGRVPCMVVGPINKGDLLVTSKYPGHAEAWQPGDSPLTVIGKALESVGEGTHVIEVKV